MLSLIPTTAGWLVGREHVRAPVSPIIRHTSDSIVAAKYVKGMYAVRVKGRVPEDVEAELESRNIRYRPRDGTDQD